MKKLLATSIFALALAFSVSVVAEGYMFNKNLKLGMRNADVKALQEYLSDAGFFTGSATGYFGSITKKAVVAFQLANDLPGTGFVGPMTREVLNAAEEPVANNNNNNNNNQNNNNNNNNVLVGSEGFAEVRVSPVVVNSPNVTSSSDVPVYAIEFKAKQSDIMVERVNLEVAVDTSNTFTSQENPSTLINTVTVKDGSTVLATIPVNSSTFSRDTTTSPSKYYVQISGLGVKVAKDTIKTLTVTVNSNSIDTDRYVRFNVYGTSGIRTVDGRGISSYNSLSDNRSHTFKKPGTSTMTAQDDATTLYSTNYDINTTGTGAEKVLTSTFAVESKTGVSKITSVTVAVNTGLLSALGANGTGGTLPSNVYLYDGSTMIDARSVTASTSASGSVTFDLTNYNVTVPVDTIKTFTIKADLPANTVAGTVVSTRVAQVAYEKPNGSTAFASQSSLLPGTVVWNYFAPAVPRFGKVSSSLVRITGANSVVTGFEAKFTLSLQALGGSINASGSTTIDLINADTGAIVTGKVASLSFIESGLTTVAKGAIKNFEVTAAFGTSTLVSGTNYKAKIRGIQWTPTSGSAQTQFDGFQALDTSSLTYLP